MTNNIKQYEYELEERIAILTIDGGMPENKAKEQAEKEIKERYGLCQQK